ncbi:hypothetical protein DN524_32110, partial [Burkholderia multivorans]
MPTEAKGRTKTGTAGWREETSMAKQTKAERIEAKVASGLSHIEAEIECGQEDSAPRITRLGQRRPPARPRS